MGAPILAASLVKTGLISERIPIVQIQIPLKPLALGNRLSAQLVRSTSSGLKYSMKRRRPFGCLWRSRHTAGEPENDCNANKSDSSTTQG
ncbi:hypothetical protein D9C83_05705 [Salinibacterium amurskyense]|nr:hypothetical protein D9C83_05705 [Salinibacterium amurskyense]